MPKGGATSLIPVSAGIEHDLDMFLRAFLEIESQRFSDYKKLFQHRRMIDLHNGRSDSAEIIEFNEQLLISCLPYMEEEVSPGVPRSLEERLFGLYSLYTFFYTQIPGHVVKIRTDPDASRNFCRLTSLLLKEKIHDAYMACLKLLEDKAFKIPAFIQVYDPSQFKLFGTESKPKTTQYHVNLNDPLARVKHLLNSDLMKSLGVVHEEYTRLKRATAGIDLGESATTNVYEQMKDSLKRQQSKMKNKTQIVTHHMVPIKYEAPKSSRIEIKEKAYNSELCLSRSRRHYTTDDIGLLPEKFDFSDESTISISSLSSAKSLRSTRKEYSKVKMEMLEPKLEIDELESEDHEIEPNSIETSFEVSGITEFFDSEKSDSFDRDSSSFETSFNKTFNEEIIEVETPKEDPKDEEKEIDNIINENVDSQNTNEEILESDISAFEDSSYFDYVDSSDCDEIETEVKGNQKKRVSFNLERNQIKIISPPPKKQKIEIEKNKSSNKIKPKESSVVSSIPKPSGRQTNNSLSSVVFSSSCSSNSETKRNEKEVEQEADEEKVKISVPPLKKCGSKRPWTEENDEDFLLGSGDESNLSINSDF